MARVLVVEDNEDLRLLLEESLAFEGHEVRSCADGRQALGQLHTLGPRTCVVLDLMLPVVTGWDVLAAIRALPVHVPVLVLSADPRATQAGADAVLTKPFDLAVLLETVERLVPRTATGS